jgi:hypothetical protein
MGEQYSNKQWVVDWIRVAHDEVLVGTLVNASMHYPFPEMVWKFSEQVEYSQLRRTLLSEDG